MESENHPSKKETNQSPFWGSMLFFLGTLFREGQIPLKRPAQSTGSSSDFEVVAKPSMRHLAACPSYWLMGHLKSKQSKLRKQV